MSASPSSHHQMHTAVRTNHVANLANLQAIRGLLKRLLHLAMAEPSQVPALVMGRAVRVLRGKFSELISGRPDGSLIASEDLDSLFLRTRNLILLPTRRAPASAVFDKEVACAYLARSFNFLARAEKGVGLFLRKLRGWRPA